MSTRPSTKAKPTLPEILATLRIQAYNNQGKPQSITLSHGLTIELTCETPHYSLNISREDVYPSDKEWTVVRGAWGTGEQVPERGQQLVMGHQKTLYARFHQEAIPLEP